MSTVSNIQKVIIFSKPSCPFCVKAKELIKKHNLNFKENIIGEDCSKEDMKQCVELFSPNTEANTVPQIFVYLKDAPISDLKYIGGCDEFYKYMGES
jgi:glutaredoxin